MKELLLYIAQNLVDHPEAVNVTEIEGDETVLELRVAPEDMGKVIGRQGRIAREIRTVIKSVAQRHGGVDVVDAGKLAQHARPVHARVGDAVRLAVDVKLLKAEQEFRRIRPRQDLDLAARSVRGDDLSGLQ